MAPNVNAMIILILFTVFLLLMAFASHALGGEAENLVVNAAVWKMDIGTDARLDTAAGTVEVSVDIDPLVYMLGVGYKF